MIAFKRIENEYTDKRLREAGFTVVYYKDVDLSNPPPGPWYFRAIGNEYDTVKALIEYANRHGIPYMDDYLATDEPGPRSKWFHYEKLKEAGIPQPETTVPCPWPVVTLTMDMHPIYPSVLKANTGGRRGLYTFLVQERDDLKRARDELDSRERYRGKNKEWLVQEYIPNEGDYRAFVVGDRCVGMYKRRPKDGVDLVMNTSDGNSRRYRGNRWPSDVARLAVRAAMTLGVTVAGVDLVRHVDTRDLYVIEVNEAPSFRVMEMRTRLDIAGEIAKEMKRHGT